MTSIPGPSKPSCTGPSPARFDVPIRPPGAKSSPAIGQSSPRDQPRTGAIGNSETRLPGARSRAASPGR